MAARKKRTTRAAAPVEEQPPIPPIEPIETAPPPLEQILAVCRGPRDPGRKVETIERICLGEAGA